MLTDVIDITLYINVINIKSLRRMLIIKSVREMNWANTSSKKVEMLE